MKRLIGGSMLTLLAVTGCSSSKEESQAVQKQHTELTEAIKKPLDDAKGAEQEIFDSAERQKQQADNL